MKRIAVAIVHGIEIDDPEFAATPTKLLEEGFTQAVGRDAPDPRDALVVEPINWAPHLERRQRQLFARMYPEGVGSYFDDDLSATIRKINAGSASSLVPLVASLVQPTVPPLRTLHYPTGRWMMAHFVGDAIAYDRSANPAGYVAAHESLARGLAALARRAGPEAPLCVIAHSFGTVLVSDYIYDQREAARGRARMVAKAVRTAQGPSALAHGDTLAWFYTMGCPLALWSLRYPEARLDRPIDVPAEHLSEHQPGLEGQWINFYDRDDIFAYPLRPLSEAYERAVAEDRPVSLKSFPVSITPLVHPFYWSERSVIDPIARTLGEAWRRMNM